MAAGADRGPHAHLALPRHGATEKQVGQVRAGDEQHERHGAQQHQQRPPRRAGDLVHERRSGDLQLDAAELRRVVLDHTRGERCRVARRLLARHAVLQAADHAVVVGIAAPLPLERVEHARQVGVRRLAVELRTAWRELDSRRHHAHDRVRPAIQHQALADRRRAREAAAAQPIADDDDRRLGTILLRQERAPLCRAHAEQRKDGGRHLRDRDALGIARHAGHLALPDPVDAEIGEGALHLAQIEEVRGRDAEARDARLGDDLVDRHQPPGIPVPERTQQHGVDEAEDDARGADAERERQHRDAGEHRRLDERAQRVTEIDAQRSHMVFSSQGDAVAALPRALVVGMDHRQGPPKVRERVAPGGPPPASGQDLVEVGREVCGEPFAELPRVEAQQRAQQPRRPGRPRHAHASPGTSRLPRTRAARWARRSASWTSARRPAGSSANSRRRSSARAAISRTRPASSMRSSEP